MPNDTSNASVEPWPKDVPILIYRWDPKREAIRKLNAKLRATASPVRSGA